jgi:hypothetical protein
VGSQELPDLLGGLGHLGSGERILIGALGHVSISFGMGCLS